MDERRSRNPYSVSLVKNCGTLSLYKIPRSRFWYFRFWSAPRQAYVKTSTRTSDRNEALHIAKLAWQQSGLPLARQIAPELTFRHWADEFLVSQARAVDRKELSAAVQKLDRGRLRNASEFFASTPIREISSARVDEYREHLHETRPGIAVVSVRHYLVAVRKVLNFAVRHGAIDAIPLMPKQKSDALSSPRCKLSLAEYRKLKDHLRIAAKSNPRMAELYDCVIFLTNTLLRPSEFKDLRFSDCKEKEGADGKPTLWVNPPHPKVRSRTYETPSMRGALFAFRRMQKRIGGNSDYLFFPTYKSRSAAIQKLGEIFRTTMKSLGLYETPKGVRTLYSLRHTGITWRVEAGAATVFEIARWARTSVAMIEKHYAREFEFTNRTEALLAKKPRSN